MGQCPVETRLRFKVDGCSHLPTEFSTTSFLTNLRSQTHLSFISCLDVYHFPPRPVHLLPDFLDSVNINSHDRSTVRWSIMAEVPLPAVVVANSSLGGTTAVPPVDGPRQASRTDHSSASSDSTSIPLQDVSGAVPPPATRTSTPDRMDPIPPSEPEMAAGSIGTVPTLDTGTQDSNATGDRVRPETGESGRRFRIPTWLNPLDQLPGLVIGILGTVYMLSSNRYAKWTTEKDFWEYCSETKVGDSCSGLPPLSDVRIEGHRPCASGV